MSSSDSSASGSPGRGSSNVIWVEEVEDNGSLRKRRHGKLVGLQGYSNRITNPIARQAIHKNMLYNAVASFLASKHFNERRGDILPQLPFLLQDCDFYWSYEYRDGQGLPLEAARQLLHSLEDSEDDHYHNKTRPQKRQLEPFAVYGAYWSRVSKILAHLSNGFEIPYISGGSTSAELDLGYPLFARTCPTNDGDARAAVVYYHQLGVTQFAVLFIKDSWGINYHASLRKYAAEFNIQVTAFAYDPDSTNLTKTLALLKQSQKRYIFAIMDDWERVVREAARLNIVGHPDYVWIAAEEKKWTGDDFQLSVGVDTDLANALHGVGTINLYFQPVPTFEQGMDEFADSKQLQQEFIDTQAAHPDIFDNYTFPKYDPTGFANTVFDAVLALGITACNASANLPPLFTGPEFHKALIQTEFQGVSGYVQFHPETGTRISSGVQYSIDYVVQSQNRSDANFHRFDSNLVAVIQVDNITHHHKFIYNDNTTIAPPALPPIQEELNLLPLWAQCIGYVLAATVMLVAILCSTWSYFKRNIFILQASQPFFLIQLCFGCFIMSMAVIPASFPGASSVGASSANYDTLQHAEVESTRDLDFACMSTLWLGCLGFAICFSSLASKIARINKLLGTGANFRRSEIGYIEVMLPLFLSVVINTTMLLCITFVAPFHYERVPVDNHYDEFGRHLESFGACRPANNKFYYFLGTILITNFFGVVLVTWEAFKARHMPFEFSDAGNLGKAMISLLETFMIGAPLLLVMRDNPTALYVGGSSMLCICCLTIMLLLFIPKFRVRNRSRRMQSFLSDFQSSRSGISGLDPRSDRGLDCSSSDRLPWGVSQVTRRDTWGKKSSGSSNLRNNAESFEALMKDTSDKFRANLQDQQNRGDGSSKALKETSDEFRPNLQDQQNRGDGLHSRNAIENSTKHNEDVSSQRDHGGSRNTPTIDHSADYHNENVSSDHVSRNNPTIDNSADDHNEMNVSSERKHVRFSLVMAEPMQ